VWPALTAPPAPPSELPASALPPDSPPAPVEASGVDVAPPVPVAPPVALVEPPVPVLPPVVVLVGLLPPVAVLGGVPARGQRQGQGERDAGHLVGLHAVSRWGVELRHQGWPATPTLVYAPSGGNDFFEKARASFGDNSPREETQCP
jgi:hypothetical protein